MQGKDLYEYAVIRIVPSVERGEFLNAGVILFCARQQFLGIRYQLDTQRIGLFSAKTDIACLQAYLRSFAAICTGGKENGTIAMQPMAYRFRWITANRSTVLQTSAVHPGFCGDAQKELDRLFEQLVL